MKKNRGLTLVEVMVSVAILGVFAGIVGITIGVLTGQRVKSMAADTKSVFQSTQIAAMGRDDAYIKLSQVGNDVQIIAYSSSGSEINRAEGHGVTMTIKNGSGNTLTGDVYVHFNRQTGGLSASASDAVSTITFSNGRRTITLNVSRLTGKVTY